MSSKPEIVIDVEAEKQEIARRYRGLLRAAKFSKSAADRKIIRKALDVAVEAHKDMRRKSGEPYIYHPIAVAKIVAEEIGLDTTSIVCALLHDTVEDTYIELNDIETLFGPKCRLIIDGLTKISGVFDQKTSAQAENFRKMLLTLSDDVRVILIKLADRLHNMRTLGAMPRDKQLKIASETEYMYAPLAHRLGLYNLKSELEDLALKYRKPEIYEDLVQKMKRTQAMRTRFTNAFTEPIIDSLNAEGVSYRLKSRTKSIFSIYNKIQNKNVSFEEIFDVFAIRIIYDAAVNKEKPEAWKIFSIVTDHYQPNPDRLRDWITIPKANGYESLHTTVMGPKGRWVEVQIRSQRMDDVSEKGLAAHWRYKDGGDSNLDNWLTQIREVLEEPNQNALEFIDDFKLNLYNKQIYVFTPNGDLKTMPQGASTLDFAFHIHTQVGLSCIGAKVNQKLVPLSHQLKSGDQIEIITSKKQRPKEDWLKFVVTASARSKIKSSLNEEKKILAEDGKDILRRKMKAIGADFISINIKEIQDYFEEENTTDFYEKVARGKINIKKLSGYEIENGILRFPREPVIQARKKTSKTPKPGSKEILYIGDDRQEIDYTLSTCCHPIPGDDVFGFITVKSGIKIHRINCPNATELLSNFAYRVIKARWASQESSQFETDIRFTGIDDIGLVNSITSVISSNMGVNMKAISFESEDGIFKGRARVLVENTVHLEALLENLRAVKGVHTVDRVDSMDDL